MDLDKIAPLHGRSRSEMITGSEEPESSTRRISRKAIPRRHFEIEEDAFMLASHDDDEPKIQKKLLIHLKNTYGLKLWKKRWSQ